MRDHGVGEEEAGQLEEQKELYQGLRIKWMAGKVSDKARKAS